MALAGTDGRVAIPLVLDAAMTRQGDEWHMTGGHGTLRGHPFAATAELREGKRHADDLKADAKFTVLDLNDLQHRREIR